MNKNLKAFELLPKKSFEVGPHNESGTLMAALVLSLSKANEATKK